LDFVSGKISIIVPVYNASKYLPRCIGSVLEQLYENWELILIDDGSTDNSLDICKKYSDNRISCYSQENHGPSSARNKGIAYSDGEFIFFLDSDDLLVPESLATLIDKCSDADWIVGDYLKIKESSVHISSGHDVYFDTSKILDKEELYNYIVLYLNKVNKYNLITHSWGALFKRSIIIENKLSFNIELKTFEDVDFNFRYLNFVENIFFVNKIVYKHTLHENIESASMNMKDGPRDLFGFQRALKSAQYLLDSLSYNPNNKVYIGQAYSTYTIIQTIRLTLSINGTNQSQLFDFLKLLCAERSTMEYFRCYKAGENESVLLPILFKLRWVWAIIKICTYKANKRYARLKFE